MKREPPNIHNIHVVAVYRDNEIVGHVPYHLAPRFPQTKHLHKSQEPKSNRGAGYGLEVPYVYHLCRPNVNVDRIEEMVEPPTCLTVN